jgi:hypothetical protein
MADSLYPQGLKHVSAIENEMLAALIIIVEGLTPKTK